MNDGCPGAWIFFFFFKAASAMIIVNSLINSKKMKNLSVSCIILSLLLPLSSYSANNAEYYRIFWNPTVRGQLLNYCEVNKSICGKAVADRYCREMGYARSNQFVKAYNVGLTHFIEASIRCKGWECNSFKHIRCVEFIDNTPPKQWHYRFNHFVYPRVDNYRLNWCYEGEQGCGRKAAFAFCRHQGFMDVKYFKLQSHVAATKSIGNQQLCFNNNCKGFAVIDCKR